MYNKMKKTQNIKGRNDVHEVGFCDLGIAPAILKIIQNLKLELPTPIQRQAIPPALSGQDIIGIAQTGTGKTFAFGIPMLQLLSQSGGQGLIVVPTRELAMQVAESLKKLGQSAGLRTAILIGGEALDRQLFQLRRKPHMIIATPGRLIDHLKRRTFSLDRVSLIVLDEADMMLDLGFAPQIAEIFEQSPQERQTMLFSATMPPAIAKIAAKYMKTPISIEVAPQGTTAAEIDQEIFIIDGEERYEHLQKILTRYVGSVLVFVRTKHGVKNLTKKLQLAGHRAVEIHSNLSLGRRKAALEGFKTKKERILVATDVAARGLDINGIELVVNYNLPDNPEDYVHRIGRTGRAGKLGKAISLAAANEHKGIFFIEKLINKKIRRTEFVKLAKPKNIQKAEKKNKDYPKNSQKAARKNTDKKDKEYPKKKFWRRRSSSFSRKPRNI
jgi:superfamily II DNA/RNA helicase